MCLWLKAQLLRPNDLGSIPHPPSLLSHCPSKSFNVSKPHPATLKAYSNASTKAGLVVNTCTKHQSERGGQLNPTKILSQKSRWIAP